MRDLSQLAILSAAVVVSLVASVAQGYRLSPSSPATAAVGLLRHREHQRHRRWSSAQLAARGARRNECGWAVGGGTVLSEGRGSTGGRAFGGELRMMMAESGAPPAKKGKGKGPYKVIANNK